jgi:hypothetical protein
MEIRMIHRQAHKDFVTNSGISRLVAQFFAPEVLAWRGEQPLWKVFWLYGVAASSVLIAIYVFAFLFEHVALRQILVLCFAPYTAWILVSIWRCSNNNNFWSPLARLLTVAWACNAIMIVMSIEMNLITHFYLGY